MNDTVARPRLAVLWRRVALVALSLVAVVQSSSVRGAQGGQTNEPFPRAARRALAHGRPAEAEALAKARPANDPAAAAVLGRLAINRGAYEDALKILEPAAAADPRSDAALELGLLSQRLGRNQQATRLLTALSRQVGPSADLETLFRAGRAAHALALPHDADAYFKAAAERGVDPAVQTEYGSMFLDIFYAADALKAFQAAVAADPEWAPGYAGVARTLADENPTAAAEAANKALEIDPTLADAHLSLAQLDLDNARYDAARERIDKVLAVNERDLDARSLLAAIAYVRTGREAFDAEAKKVLAINPAFRRGLSRRRRPRRAELPVRRSGRAVAGSGRARPVEHAGVCRSRHAPDADRRRRPRRARRSTARSARSVRQGHLQPARPARHARQVRRRAGRGPHVQVQSRRNAGDARVRHPAGAGRAEDAVGEVPVHAEGADPDRDLPEPRRLRGPHARPARADRRARRVLRPGGQHRLAEGPRARHVLVAGDAVARADARHHAADVEPARAALADRRHLGLRGRAGASRVGPRDGSARSRSRWSRARS